jgi:hypothetical protein
VAQILTQKLPNRGESANHSTVKFGARHATKSDREFVIVQIF